MGLNAAAISVLACAGLAARGEGIEVLGYWQTVTPHWQDSNI